MKPPHFSSSGSPGDPRDDLSEQQRSEQASLDNEAEFEQALQTVEQDLQALKAFYAEIQQDSQQKTALEQQIAEVKQALSQSRSPWLKAELRRLKKQLDTLEIALESRFFTWKPFWQAVRFGGLGLIVGWMLKSWIG